MTEINIEIGSVWADNYEAAKGRTIRIDEVTDRYVHATILTNSAIAQRALDDGSPWHRDRRGQTTRVLRTAFRATPGKRGYSPVQEVASDG